MSLPHTIWAWGLENIGPSEKLVLVYLAQAAREDTGQAWPSVRTLSKVTSLSVRTVQRATMDLQAKGLLIVAPRVRTDRSHTSNLYVLPLLSVKVEVAPVLEPPPSDSTPGWSRPGDAPGGVTPPPLELSSKNPQGEPSREAPTTRRARARPDEEDAAREEAEDWYRNYPKKVDPDGTKTKYVHLRLTKVLPPRDVMFERLERQKACDQWLRGFIPHSKTYLNQKRWEDSNALPEKPQPAAPPPSNVEPLPRLAAVLVGNRYEDRVWLDGETYTRDEWTAMGRAWPA